MGQMQFCLGSRRKNDSWNWTSRLVRATPLARIVQTISLSTVLVSNRKVFTCMRIKFVSDKYYEHNITIRTREGVSFAAKHYSVR